MATEAYVTNATSALDESLSSRLSLASLAATNYTDAVATDVKDGTRHVNYADSAFYADEARHANYLYDSSFGEVSASDLIRESTNAAVAVTDTKISTNNSAFVSAVLAAPLVGADTNDLSEIAEYGSYGTVGAALLALIAGLAALKRRITSAETAISGKANATDLPYAMVTPGEWEFIGLPGEESSEPIMQYRSESGRWELLLAYDGESDIRFADGTADDLVVDFDYGITATRPSLPGHLCDRAVNAVAVSAATTLTLPALVNAGKARDFLVRLAFGTIAEGASVPTVIFQGQGDEAPDETDAISFVTDDGEFPVPDSGGDWWYSLTECAPHVFAVSLKQLQSVSQPTQAQGGS
jgi:hypothetical protein